jgi:hypothetical protein
MKGLTRQLRSYEASSRITLVFLQKGSVGHEGFGTQLNVNNTLSHNHFPFLNDEEKIHSAASNQCVVMLLGHLMLGIVSRLSHYELTTTCDST